MLLSSLGRPSTLHIKANDDVMVLWGPSFDLSTSWTVDGLLTSVEVSIVIGTVETLFCRRDLWVSRYSRGSSPFPRWKTWSKLDCEQWQEILIEKPAHKTSAMINQRSTFHVPVPASEMDIHAFETLIYIPTFTHAYATHLHWNILILKRPHIPPHTYRHMLQYINLFCIFFPLPGLNLNWKIYGKVIRPWDCQKSRDHISLLGLGSCTIITAMKSSGSAYFPEMCLRFRHILHSF